MIEQFDETGSGLTVDPSSEVGLFEPVKKVVKKKVIKGQVIGGNLNVRESNNAKSSIIKVLKDKTKVIILEEGDIFYKVNVDGDIGYCMKKFIKKVK